MTRLQQKSKAAKLRAMPKKKTVPTPALSDYLSQIGRKGGKARLETMTEDQRKESARKAAQARWGKRKKQMPQ